MKIDTVKIANDIYVRETRRYQNVRKRDYYPVEYHQLCLIINPETYEKVQESCLCGYSSCIDYYLRIEAIIIAKFILQRGLSKSLRS